MSTNNLAGMSNKRPLTPQECEMADAIKRAMADKKLTEERLGEIVGVSQGMVSHWTGRRLPVSAKRAPRLAEALGFSDPGEISMAYRDIASPGPLSQPLGLTPDSLRYAITILRRTYKRAGRELDLKGIEDNPKDFINACEVALVMRPELDQVKGPLGAAKDERGNDLERGGHA